MKKVLLTIGLAISTLIVSAQDNPIPKEVDHSYKPLTMKLNEDGSKYMRFIVWHQIWATSNNLSDSRTNFQTNISMRRSRMLAFAQISPRFLVLTHFGLNNMNTANMTSLGNNGDAPQMFLHDAWGEFKIDDKLFIGAGLHYWKGLTRLASQSTLNFMTLDQSRPFAHWHSLGITDQFARHFGVYFKGDLGPLEYRVAVNNPMAPANALGAGRHYGDVASNFEYVGSATPKGNGDRTGNTIIEGYFKWDFLDKESYKLPYYVGTYFGAKKFFSVGAGFFAHPNAMFDTLNNRHGNVSHFAADVFFDHPAPGGGINAYASVQSFNYGKNYMSRWVGTGTTLYGHLGYFIKKVKMMPYGAFQHGYYDGLTQNPSALDLGLNYFINGHNAKLTLEYHTVVNNRVENANPGNDMSQVRLQAHFFL